jgi:hypothetical protein
VRSSADTINYANIGLMALSCLAAYVFPFELFLFSYAVLGPLHYLTEISWLHDREYFVKAGAARRAWPAERYWLALVAVTLAVMLYGLAAERILRVTFSPAYEIGLFYIVFVSACVLVFVKNKAVSAVLVVLTALSLVFVSSSRYFGLVAFFLITIVHVFVFTAAFVLFGALKGRSRSGILSLIVFFLCAVSFFVYAPSALGPRLDGRGLCAPQLRFVPDAQRGTDQAVPSRHRRIADRNLRLDGRTHGHAADRLRVHVPLPQLVLEDVDHQVARDTEEPGRTDCGGVAELVGRLRVQLRHGNDRAVLFERPARHARVSAEPPDVRQASRESCTRSCAFHPCPVGRLHVEPRTEGNYCRRPMRFAFC